MANGIQVIPTLDRFAGLRQGALNLVGGLQQQALMNQRQQALQNVGQQLGLNFPQGLDPRIAAMMIGNAQQAALAEPTEAEQKQAAANLALTEAQTTKALAPTQASQSNLIGRLGTLISEGKATKGQMEVFNRLTEKAGTSVNINNIESLGTSLQSQVAALKEGQDILNQFTSDPANAEVLKNSDVNVVTNTKGQLQLEVKPKDAPAATQIKELSDIIGLQDNIETIESLFDPSFVGVVEGNPALAAISEATGVGISSKEVQFRRVANDLSDKLLRARSGAQINEQEFQRLKKILPDMTKSEVSFKARLEDFKREISNILSTKKKIIQQSGKRPLDFQPPRGEVPSRANILNTGPRTPQQEARMQELLQKAGR